MIIDFTLGNSLSFKDNQTLSMVASPPYDIHASHILDSPDKKLKLLKLAVIYGSNASGKSNLLSSLNYLKSLVLNSTKNKPDNTFNYIPFLFDKRSSQKPTFFEINFYCENIRYNYSISMDRHKIHHEYLSYYPKNYKRNIFMRDLSDTGEYKYTLGADLKPKRVFEDITLRTSKNVLFLSKASQENSKEILPIYNWFNSILSEELDIDEMAEFIANEDSNKENLLNFLCKQDVDIVDLNIEKLPFLDKINEINDIPSEIKTKLLEDYKDKFSYRIQTFHKDNEGNNIPLPFELESQGTQKLFSLASLLLNDDKEMNKVFYVDELSSALHPLLVRNFIKSFQKSKNQLICVTHDTHLINQDYLRKDQIYFIEKNKEQASELYSLVEFENIRNDRQNWELRYLSGSFGATPNLRNYN
ncbi:MULTISPECIES: AAA family ATPase [unclassified Moraxella]|uniref:AAA family ATPase n=1 Tax=unclassified Moraxella TaxID=2685852 RepID=UPI003AF78BED